MSKPTTPPQKRKKLESGPAAAAAAAAAAKDDDGLFMAFFSGEEVDSCHHIMGPHRLLDGYVVKKPRDWDDDEDPFPEGKTLRWWLETQCDNSPFAAQVIADHLLVHCREEDADGWPTNIFREAKAREKNVKEYFYVNAFE